MKTRIIFLVSLLILVVSSCKKETKAIATENAALTDSEMNVVLNTEELTCYPNDSTSFRFNLQTSGGEGPYTYTWKTPSSLSGSGPFSMQVKNDIVLEVDVKDSHNLTKTFYYAYAIDPLKHDYRDKYTGVYNCELDTRIMVIDTTGYHYDYSTTTTTLTLKKSPNFKSMLIDSTTEITFYNPDHFTGPRIHGFIFATDSFYMNNMHPAGTYSYTYNGKKIH